MSEKSDVTIDVRGETCPYPDIRTRKKLKEMKSGEILEVLTDYPLSLERIPRNVEKQGHEVISVTKIKGADHKILIKVKK